MPKKKIENTKKLTKSGDVKKLAEKPAAEEKSMLFSCTWGLLDVKTGRTKLAKIIERGDTVPVVIHGLIFGDTGNDDGVSREFELEIVKIAPPEHFVIPAGTSFASVKQVVPGDVLITDDGFPCMAGGIARVVYRDHDIKNFREGLYIQCTGKAGPTGNKDGRHYLSGQRSDHLRKLKPGEPLCYTGLWLMRDLIEAQDRLVADTVVRLEQELADAKASNLDLIKHDIPRKRRTVEPSPRAKLDPRVKAIVEGKS